MSGPPVTGSEASPASVEHPPPPRWKQGVAAAAAVVSTLGVAAGVAGVAGMFEPSRPPQLPPGPDDAAGSIDTVPGGAGQGESAGSGASGGTDQAADSRRSPDPDRVADPSPEWLDTVSEATGIPRRALEGYARAQLAATEEQPACRISWPTLAAVGEIESGHGTAAGGEIGADGRTTEDVIGIPLDGTDNTAAIPDSDGGSLDGDSEWDRAVGPMQFIPTTWRTWGADADSAAGADPHDIDDAALSAARYLCSEGRVLTSDSGWWDAILTYNESRSYGEDVLAAADRYATEAAEAV
ncbi:lytic murein transglycosylase [Streptomonospora wellingtoniae]|uniref:Lytic murein transglycosylase n=1 Tax=Streptomonospora wellingtoniae TaxID=3075544 RepID=A0ABU2KYK1_9ACTN|nr:lytic murein transglycosylase [Streptomonospora sp. DSM 45055]MDT0304389.1 lytic murein transglycosylase [Streptomonospora sp. DSM 45055]